MGEKLIRKDLLNKWKDTVILSSKTNYGAEIIKSSLLIIQELSEYKDFEEIYNKILSENLSGAMFWVVINNVKKFSDMGNEFQVYCKNKFENNNLSIYDKIKKKNFFFLK